MHVDEDRRHTQHGRYCRRMRAVWDGDRRVWSWVALTGAVLLTACGGGASESTEISPDTTQGTTELANPAAVFCEEQGGAVFGPEPMCGLPDGTTVDAWEYYRAETTGATTPESAVPTTSEPAATTAAPTTTEPAPPDQIDFLEGEGTQLVVLDADSMARMQSGLIDATHDGTGAFRVAVLDSNGETIEVLIDATGPYAGRRPWAITEHYWPDAIEVEADGAWRFRVLDGFSGSASEHLLTGAIGSTYTGHGDDVLSTSLDDLTILKFTCTDCTGPIEVTAYGSDTLSIQATGDGTPSEHYAVLSLSTWLIEIEATHADGGDWTVELEAGDFGRIEEIDPDFACRSSNGRGSTCEGGGSTPLWVINDCASGDLPLDQCDDFPHPDRDGNSGAGPVCPTYEYRSAEPYYLCTQGSGVETLQRALVFCGYMSGTADGYFGPGTDAAVRVLQGDYGVAQDGIVQGAWYREFIETYNLSR